MSHERQRDEERIVTAMAEMMREKLARRRHHGPWHDMSARDVLRLLWQEIGELEQACVGVRDLSAVREDVIAEAVDVANYCAILIDVLAGDES